MCLLQTFSSNMSVKGKPVLKPAKKDTFTCVTFKPDLAKFGMVMLEEQTVSLMRKRVYDLAGVLGKTVKVGCHVTASCMRNLNVRSYIHLAPSPCPVNHTLRTKELGRGLSAVAVCTFADAVLLCLVAGA